MANGDRGQLIMACGTGKTFTSLKVAEPSRPPTSPSAEPYAAATGTPATTGGGRTRTTHERPTSECTAAPNHRPRHLRGLCHVSRGIRNVPRDAAGLEHQHLDRQHHAPRHRLDYRATEQGEESNHYPGPIPMGDVRRRLLDWEAVSRPIAVEVPAELDTMTHLNEFDIPARWQVLADRQAICRSDTDAVMGVFTRGYEMHQYDEWLLTTVANILDGDLSISSAGHLRGGAIAWVEVSVPESITTPEGVVFRPNLLATTSFDGSIATTFKRTITDVVCDNTREAALREDGQTYKVKHSRYSHAHGPIAHPGRQEARHPAAALPARPAGLAVGGHRAWGGPGREHLRAPRGHRPRWSTGRTEHAPRHHRRVRQARPQHPQHPHPGARLTRWGRRSLGAASPHRGLFFRARLPEGRCRRPGLHPASGGEYLCRCARPGVSAQ